MNRLALLWTILTYTRMHSCTQKGTSNQELPHTHIRTCAHTHNQKANIFPFSRQIQFLSKTYVSWLKWPTKTREICHILQDGTQNWVLLYHWHAFPFLSSISFSRDLSASLDGIMHPFQSFLYLFPSFFFPCVTFLPRVLGKANTLFMIGYEKPFMSSFMLFFLSSLYILNDWNCALVMSSWITAGGKLLAFTYLCVAFIFFMRKDKIIWD